MHCLRRVLFKDPLHHSRRQQFALKLLEHGIVFFSVVEEMATDIHGHVDAGVSQERLDPLRVPVLLVEGQRGVGQRIMPTFAAPLINTLRVGRRVILSHQRVCCMKKGLFAS